MRFPSTRTVLWTLTLALARIGTPKCDYSVMNAVALTCEDGQEDPSFSCVQLRQMPIPKPGDRQVLVRVHASSVNPVDYKILSSLRGLPKVLGFDISGVVVAKGRGCGERLKIGDKVWADLGKIKFFGLLPQPQLGAYAEYAIADASQTGLMPSNLDFKQAASLPLVSLTSFQAFKKVASSLKRSNVSVAITSGAGGTGFVAIQLAKAYGAVEIITACSAQHVDFVRELGATKVVDYANSSIWDHVASNSLDVVYDNYGAPGTADKALDKIRKGGSFIFLPGRGGALSPSRKPGVRQLNFHVTSSAHHQDLDALRNLVEAGKIKPRIQKVFPLASVRSALKHMKAGHVAGKFVIAVSAPNTTASDEWLDYQ